MSSKRQIVVMFTDDKSHEAPAPAVVSILGHKYTVSLFKAPNILH